MDKLYFKNGHEGNTPIPKAMWWYICETQSPDIHVNANLCNKLLNNEMKSFFEKYPEELYKKVTFDLSYHTSNITKEDIEFYKGEMSNV